MRGARRSRLRGSAIAGPLTLALAVALTLALAAVAPAPAAAQRSLVFERLHSDVEVQPSGDLIVTETLHPRFTGQWNGVVRRLSRRHTTAAGERERLDIQLLSAHDGAGGPLRMEETAVDGDTREVRIWVPDALDRTAEVVLRYRVRGAIRFFAAGSTDSSDMAEVGRGAAAAYDELYWQVTGTDWEVPIEDASARIVLPEGATALQAAAYRGTPASGEQVEVAMPGQNVDLDSRQVVVPSSGYLRPGEGLTVAVAWPAGLVPVPAGVARSRPVRFGPTGSVLAADSGPGPLRTASWWALLPLFLPMLVFWRAHRAWSLRGRDPREKAITVRWEPPLELGPAEAGTLVDHHPGMHDIISTLVHLAVRGYVVIAEREKKGLFQGGSDYALHLMRPRTDWDDLAAHERRFLDGLFGVSSRSQVLANLAEEGSFLDGILTSVGGEPASGSAPDGTIQSVLLSDLQNEFYKELPGIRDALLDSLVAKGHYLRRPDRVRAVWAGMTAAALGLGFLAIPAFATATATGVVLGISVLVAAGVSALILGVFAFLMPARTEQGARTREATLGFKRFLERVEAPRYRRMITSPHQFEEYLPYAMAFDCAEQWATAFDDLLTEPPTWYHGHHGTFRPTVFASDLSTLASTASSTMASSPSSSSSGSGGGGSGGGGGGGF